MVTSIYIKLPRLCVCECVFRNSEKRVDPLTWNFAWFMGVIGRLEWIKTSGKFWPLMCKILENGAKLPTSRRSPRTTQAGVRNGCRLSSRLCYDSGMCQSGAGLGAWPVAFHAGPSQMLPRRRGHRSRRRRGVGCGPAVRLPGRPLAG